MRAIVFSRGGEPLTLETLPDPEPGPGEMVLKVGRCGICGSDVHLTQEHGWYPENSPIGHEFAGEVVALGTGVEGFKLGDIVTSQPAAGCGNCPGCHTGHTFACTNVIVPYAGGFADYVRVAARTSIKLPSTLTMADGALVEPLSVGLHGVAMAGVEPGSRVLVLGAGAIGLAATYWARQLGAGRIGVASRSRQRAALAEQMGADVFVQTGEGEGERIAAALGGPPDIVIECIGVVGALTQSIAMVRTGGTVVSLGFCTKPDPILPGFATFKQARLLFSMAYTLREFQHAADMLDRGHVEPRLMLGDTIALEAVPNVILQMRSGSYSGTKVQADPALAGS